MAGENASCVQGATNEQRIKSLEARVLNTETAIVEIRDRLLARPTWAVMFIISVLSSACVGLTVRTVTQGNSFKAAQTEFRQLNDSLRQIIGYIKAER